MSFRHLGPGSDTSKPPPPCAPVASVYVMGANEWRGYAEWPPPYSPKTLWLGSDGELYV
jgi:hypothetical protein